MKDEKAKYLMIDAMEISKQLYNMKREFAFNDFDNIYIPAGMITAREIFNNYGIPEEFQKIIVKVNMPFCLKYESYEYIIRFPFDITGGKIEKKNGYKYIEVFNYPVFYGNNMFNDMIKFRTQLKYFRYNEVIDFLSKVNDSGYLKLYLQSIKEFFGIALELDYLYEVWDEEKDVKKALTRYRQKYPINCYMINKI